MLDKTERRASEMKKVVSEIIATGLKDPRIPMMSSVVHLKLTKDLKYATIYVSVYGDEKEKADCMEALKSANGFIRREIGQRMKIRSLPELTFKLDESMEYAAYMSDLIDKTIKADENSEENDD